MEIEKNDLSTEALAKVEEFTITMENKIVRNTSYFTIALVMQKIISFVYFSYLATQIGSESTGKYFFAISFATIFSVFVDLGLGNLLVRESAKKENDSQKLLGNAITIKLISSVFVILIIAFMANILNYPILTKKLIYLASIAMILDNFTLIFFSTIRGKHNLKYESIGSIIFQLIILVLGFITLQKTKNIALLIIVLITASLFNILYSAIVLKFKYFISLKPRFDKLFIKNLIIMSWPFAIAAIFMRISGNIDSIFLSKLADERALGYYSLPYKITFAFQFIPMAFSASLYPAFTHFFNEEKQKLKNILDKSIIYLILISMPIAIGISYVANTIITKIYGNDYLNSILTLQILIFNLPFIFLTFPTGAMLNAGNLQKTHTKNIGLTMVLTIILDLILIPKYSQNGAAIASVFASIFYMTLNFISCNKIIKPNYKKIFTSTVKILLSCLLMIASIILLQNHTSFFVFIPISGIIYIFSSLFIFKTIKREDLALIKSGLKK